MTKEEEDCRGAHFTATLKALHLPLGHGGVLVFFQSSICTA